LISSTVGYIVKVFVVVVVRVARVGLREGWGAVHIMGGEAPLLFVVHDIICVQIIIEAYYHTSRMRSPDGPISIT
jgi:hypothetical protein